MQCAKKPIYTNTLLLGRIFNILLDQTFSFFLYCIKTLHPQIRCGIYMYLFFGQRAFKILCSWRLRSEITYCQKKTSMIVVQLVLRVYTQTTPFFEKQTIFLWKNKIHLYGAYITYVLNRINGIYIHGICRQQNSKQQMLRQQIRWKQISRQQTEN